MHVIAKPFGGASRSIDRAALRTDHVRHGARQPCIASLRRVGNVARHTSAKTHHDVRWIRVETASTLEDTHSIGKSAFVGNRGSRRDHG